MTEFVARIPKRIILLKLFQNTLNYLYLFVRLINMI